MREVMKMKKFEAPEMNISRFITENILTTSVDVTAASKAITGLTSNESDLLGGRQSLDKTSIVQFIF